MLHRSGALVRRPYGARLLLALLTLLPCAAGCGGGDRDRHVPALSIHDGARVITPEMRTSLHRSAGMASRLGVKIAVVTVRNLNPRDAASFADRMFAEYPDYRSLYQGGIRPKPSLSSEVVAEEWAPYGLLICVSLEPRLVQVRVGYNLLAALPDDERFRFLNGRTYPRVASQDLRGGVMEVASTIVGQLTRDHFARRQPGGLRMLVKAGTMHLRRVSRSSWLPYSALLFDPLLNGLALLLKAVRSPIGAVLIWMLAIHLVFSRGVFPLLRLRFARDRKTKRTLRWVAAAVGVGLGVPMLGVMTLLATPLQENVLAVQSHLYGPVRASVPVQDLFAFQDGLLWWRYPLDSGGMRLALTFAALFLPLALSLIAAAAAQVPHTSAGGPGDPGDEIIKRVAQLLVLPVVLAQLPLVLGIYYLTAVIASAAWTLFDLRRRQAQHAAAPAAQQTTTVALDMAAPTEFLRS